MSKATVICLLGFGEVGQTLAADLRGLGHRQLVAWDIAFADERSTQRAAAASGLASIAASIGDAVTNADIVISAVTAAQCLPAAVAASVNLKSNAFFMDLNSVSPLTRRRAEKSIRDAGGRYVEAAVMAPIGPRRIASSMLLGGPYAEEFDVIAREAGFTGVRTFSEQTGKASAAKMCRSVMIKGIEALLTESLLAARRYGVENTVVESMRDLFPGTDWQALSGYMISRSLQHGRRRAEEMFEVARSVSDTGVEPVMSLAIAQRQDWAGTRAIVTSDQSLAVILDTLLANIL